MLIGRVSAAENITIPVGFHGIETCNEPWAGNEGGVLSHRWTYQHTHGRSGVSSTSLDNQSHGTLSKKLSGSPNRSPSPSLAPSRHVAARSRGNAWDAIAVGVRVDRKIGSTSSPTPQPPTSGDSVANVGTLKILVRRMLFRDLHSAACGGKLRPRRHPDSDPIRLFIKTYRHSRSSARQRRVRTVAY